MNNGEPYLWVYFEIFQISSKCPIWFFLSKLRFKYWYSRVASSDMLSQIAYEGDFWCLCNLTIDKNLFFELVACVNTCDFTVFKSGKFWLCNGNGTVHSFSLGKYAHQWRSLEQKGKTQFKVIKDKLSSWIKILESFIELPA